MGFVMQRTDWGRGWGLRALPTVRTEAWEGLACSPRGGQKAPSCLKQLLQSLLPPPLPAAPAQASQTPGSCHPCILLTLYLCTPHTRSLQCSNLKAPPARGVGDLFHRATKMARQPSRGPHQAPGTRLGWPSAGAHPQEAGSVLPPPPALI